ncbi:MAG: TlpA family protein disulfide reductase [Paramuribaculum sp.]|nr:TlpA family protein disulfide reductase [Paramuribaculum sp.]
MTARLLTAIILSCISLIMQAVDPSPMMIPIKKIEADSKHAMAYSGRLKKAFYNPSDSAKLDSAYINLQGTLIYKFYIKDDSVHYEFLKRLNTLNLSNDASIVLPVDSALTYMQRARGKAVGTIPSWKVGSIEIDNKKFDVRAKTCGVVTYSYPEELFLNDFNIYITAANVYEAALGDSCNLEIYEYAWHDEKSPSHIIEAKNEYGCDFGKYRPKVVNGRVYKELKLLGDLVQTGPDTYYRLDGFNAEHDSLIVTQVEGATLPTYQLSEAQLNILSPYLTKAREEGKLLLIDFWGTWCNPCLSAMPYLSKLLKLFHDKVALLGVCVDAPNSFDKAAKLLKENEIEGMEAFEVFEQQDGLVTVMDVHSFPTYILLNSDGSVLMLGSGLQAIGSLFDILGALYPDKI